jgi:hypothetical protein
LRVPPSVIEARSALSQPVLGRAAACDELDPPPEVPPVQAVNARATIETPARIIPPRRFDPCVLELIEIHLS